MFLLILKIAVLLAVIIIPLMPEKKKVKKSVPLTIDSDTSDANYAINENGALEKIRKHSLTDN